MSYIEPCYYVLRNSEKLYVPRYENVDRLNFESKLLFEGGNSQIELVECMSRTSIAT